MILNFVSQLNINLTTNLIRIFVARVKLNLIAESTK